MPSAGESDHQNLRGPVRWNSQGALCDYTTVGTLTVAFMSDKTHQGLNDGQAHIW